MPGRGYAHNIDGRFKERHVDPTVAPSPIDVPTAFHVERARSIVNGNQSPDIPFDWSINSYRGCEHGCVYCFARPTHAYVDLSPGNDFESQIYCKTNGRELLLKYLARPSYRAQPITLGASTDPYQPAERRYRLTRELLEVFLETRHPVSIVTKGTLIERDLDLIEALAGANLCHVAVSLPTLDRTLKRALEPRVASAERRLKTIRRLADAGVTVTVLIAPVIPALTDAELESIIAAAADNGARHAGYVLLRLPHELEPLFSDWLRTHLPLRAEHVLSLLRQLGNGKTYVSEFGVRQRGRGPFADLLRQRFQKACQRHGLQSAVETLSTDLFRPPTANGAQQQLPF